MAAQEVLTGIQIHRNGRYPYDYEQVQNSYSDVLKNIESDGEHGTKKGTFYAGMYTAVVDDENSSYNGPYYISYQKTGNADNLKITYQATRIPLANEIAEIEKDWQTSHDTLRRYVQENFVTHTQLNRGGELADAAYVSYLGREANLNVILSSLLTPAEYKRPSYKFKFLDGENGKEYGYITNLCSNNSYVIEVGSRINLWIDLGLSYYNTNNNRIGMSYGLSYCSFSHNNVNHRFTSLGKHNLGVSYTFMNEGSHSMTDGKPISLCYLKSSYQGYPQILKKGVYVPSKENWYKDSLFKIDDYRIVAQFKYYYGWDANISSNSFNPTQGTAKWLPIIKSGETTTTPNISFDKSHTSFWYAIPADIVAKVSTSGFDILYHTSIGDADLVSTSTTKTNAYKTINGHRYTITKVDFNKTISGATGNYVKFSMIK